MNKVEEQSFRVSLFANVHDRNPQVTDLSKYIQRIKTDGEWKQKAEHYRTLKTEGKEDDAARIKKSMEAITPAGIFEGGHRASQLQALSGLTSLDMDGTNERTEEICERLRALPYVRGYHRSISGAGIKVFLHIGIRQAEEYAEVFAMVKNSVEQEAGFRCDAACKDICRLCYASHDPQAHYNPESRPFDKSEDSVSETGEENKTPRGGEALFEKTMKLLNRKMLYIKGNRNNYIFTLLCDLKRKGMGRNEAQSQCLQAFDLTAMELEGIVQSAYNQQEESPKKKGAQVTAEKRQENIREMEQYINAHYELRLNTVLNRIEFRNKTSEGEATTTANWEPMADYDENSVYRNLLLAGFKVRMSTLHNILNSDFVTRFDPFQAYFDSLPPWDGVTDYIGQLAASVTTTRQPYWERCLRKWFVAMVAGWLRPEVVNHSVLLLVGTQGIYKTSWSLRLMPPPLERYRYSGIINPRDKDSMFTLSQCGLINNEEVENLSQRELNEFKAMITQSVINERAAYGRNKEYLVRRASFIGSGNNKDILVDTTGNRRWLCFEVLAIRPAEEFAFPYEGMYAQAKALLDGGFRYWFDKAETRDVNDENGDFVLRSVEEEQLMVWFRVPAPGEPGDYLTASQIMGKLMVWVRTPMSVVRIGRALKATGFSTIKKDGIKMYKVVERSLEEVEANKKSQVSGQDRAGLKLPF